LGIGLALTWEIAAVVESLAFSKALLTQRTFSAGIPELPTLRELAALAQ
jgi:hypothetical protein